jgi:uncharacterized protein (DUF2141 family)
VNWALLAAAVLGDAGCGSAPAIRVSVEGLKDRRGELKLELYPANERDWLRDDRDLVREGKLFRRVRVPTPQDGPVVMCIRVPGPGRYALFFTHNRDGKNKFSFWADGAGLPGNAKLGRARPKLAQGIVDVGGGTAGVTIRAQYLRGLSGFGPER